MVMLGGRDSLGWAFLIGELTVTATILTTFAGSARQSLDQRLSVRPSIKAAAMVWKDFSLERSSTYKLQRSFQFSLNFYSHRELPAWSPDSQHGWVFASHSEISDLRNRSEERRVGKEC